MSRVTNTATLGRLGLRVAFGCEIKASLLLAFEENVPTIRGNLMVATLLLRLLGAGLQEDQHRRLSDFQKHHWTQNVRSSRSTRAARRRHPRPRGVKPTQLTRTPETM